MTTPFSRIVPTLLAGLLLFGCSHQQTKPFGSRQVGSESQATAATPRPKTNRASHWNPAPSSEFEEFEEPAGLAPQVAFWRNVYAVWSQAEVAIHDDRYLDVIYEVIEIPGVVGDSLSAEQKDWLKMRRDDWKFRLGELESKVAGGQALDRGDRELLTVLGDRNRLAGAADRVRSQRGLRERFRRGLEISRRYDAQFRRIFRDAGLPEDLAYLPHVESSFQASAKSSAGAVGIWQFTRAAAQRYMTVNEFVDERLDPIAATRGAARYLRDAYERLGSWPLALTSYNHGVNGMRRAKELLGDDLVRIIQEYDHPLFGFASRNFYAEFLAARQIARQPERYFADLGRDFRRTDRDPG